MPLPRVSPADVQHIGEIVASASDVDAALDRLALEVARAFASRVCIFQRTPRGWTLQSQSGGGLRLPIGELELVLDALPPVDPIAPLNLEAFGAGRWTALAFAILDVSWLLLIAGDVTAMPATAALSALLPFAVQRVRDRERRRRDTRVFTDSYALTRRLGRLRTPEAVSDAIVRHVAHALHADRVTLALYQPDGDRIRVVAARGEAAAALLGIAAEPGAWVMGHVYASGRPVVVDDVGQLPWRPHTNPAYRTTSFASVPLIAGRDTIGVLNITDKRDRAPFGRSDLRLLRSFSATAALGIKAAMTDTEVHRLARVASVDALTTLFNRPYFDTRLHQEIERAKRNQSSLTLLLADIDDFKAVNDTYGHQIGDAVLQAVGGALRSAIRVFDICARYGGDEFAILMPSSDQASALAFAERIRQRVATTSPDSRPAGLPPVTLSIGIALFEGTDAPEHLVRRADESLYAAKSAGKNRVGLGTGRTNVLRLPVSGSGHGGTS